MSVRARLLRIGILLVVGVILGSVLGSIVTGDPAYTVGWAVGLPILLTVAGIVGSVRKKASTPVAETPPGIISSANPRPAQTEAVLNPEPTAILNGAKATPRRETSSGVPWWSRVLAILTILVGAALVLIPAYRMIGWTATNIAQGRFDGNDMRTGLHQQEAIDDLTAVIGGSEFVSIYFYDGYVLAEAPTRPGATTTDLWQWRYGRAVNDGPYSGSIDGLFDASAVDFSMIPDLVARARAETGWEQVTTTYPSVRANEEGVPEITIALGNDYYSASYTYDLRGELVDSYTSG